MKKRRKMFMRRMAAVILTLCMIMGMVSSVITVEAHGNSDGYPYNVAAGSYVADQWGFYQCECTSFVAWCLNARNGFGFSNGMYGSDIWGNANNWGDVARRHGFAVDGNPAVGAVAWSSSGTYGHVAWVCAVNGDNVTIDEYNNGWVTIAGEYHGNHKYNTRTVHKSAFQYIHLKDISESSSVPQGSPISGGSRTISDGDYHIVSSVTGTILNPGLSCLTIGGLPDAKNNNGAPAQLWSVSGQKDHVFTVTWLENGFYKIKLKESDNKCLDVVGGYTDRGTDVQQWEDNGTSAQQWRIDERDDGIGYTIRSRCNGWYLDVYNGETADGTKIHLWEGNTTNAQKWYFIPWSGSDSDGLEIPDGNYEIIARADGSKALNAVENGYYVELNTRKDNLEHVFSVTNLGNGYCKIINKNSGLSLDVANGKSLNGANVQLCGWSEGTNHAQQWLIKSCGNGYYNIISKLNGLYLDPQNAKTDDGTNIQMCVGWGINGADCQQWRFVPSGKSIGRTIEDGEYQIVPQMDKSKVLSSDGNGAEIGTNLILSANKGDEKHVFNITYMENGYYSIVNRNAGLSLDNGDGVDDAYQNGTNAGLWERHNGTAQQWMIKPHEDGSYNIISRCTGLCLDVSDGNPTDGTNVWMWMPNQTDAQKWKLIPYNKKVDIESIRLEKVELTMSAGSQEALKAMFSPQDATDKTLTWKSSNPSVAEVDVNGRVTAKTPGTAVVIATTSNGKTEFCQVTVTKENQPSTHTHSYVDAWKTNNKKHWKECECGDKLGEAEHKFSWVIDRVATVENTGMKHEECEMCGYMRNEGTTIEKISSTHMHSYGKEWKTSKEKHWKECECGAKSEESLHKFTWIIDRAATEETIGIKHEECETCGRRRNEGTVIEKLPVCQHIYQVSQILATLKKDGIITEICSKCGNEKSKTTIHAVDSISLSRMSYAYDGKTKKPSVKVKDSSGKMLRDKVDYTVYYSGKAKNVGSYTVTITLKGNYSGIVKKTFEIVPKGTSISKISAQKKGFALKWKKQTKQTSGYEIAYSTSNKFVKKNTKTVTVKKNKISSKSISKLKTKKKYYVKIRTYKTVRKNGKLTKIYSTWSKVKAVTTKK